MRHNDPPTAYAACTAQIDVQLTRLQRRAANPFVHDRDAIHWVHVGDLGRVEQALDELLAILDGKAE